MSTTPARGETPMKSETPTTGATPTTSATPATSAAPGASTSPATALPEQRVGLVWAQARGRVIGSGGAMPWHLPEDGAHFRRTTSGAAVIMGRATWDSLPERFRPLPGRTNVVLTRRTDLALDGATVVGSLDDALAVAAQACPGRVWVMGGGEVYREAIDHADLLVATEIDLEVEGDTLAPEIGAGWVAEPVVGDETDPDGWAVSRTGLRFRFVEHRRAAPRRAAPRP